MREIKFRAWDNESNQMIYTDNDEWSNDFAFSLSSQGILFHANEPRHVYYEGDREYNDWKIADAPIMQYTGLKDKNNKEIYEGDFLDGVGEKPVLVQWNNHFASFCLDMNGWMYSHWFGESCKPEDTEVIGNIYENPELLNT